MSKDAIWLYHQDEAPEGRLFNKLDGKEAEKLHGDGWVDTPAKFGDKDAKRTKKDDDTNEPVAIARMNVGQLEDYIVQRGGFPEGSKADKVKLALSLPADPASTAPADMEDAEDGDGINDNPGPDQEVVADLDAPKPVDNMTEVELREELEKAEVNVSASTTVENLKAAVKALRGE